MGRELGNEEPPPATGWVGAFRGRSVCGWQCPKGRAACKGRSRGWVSRPQLQVGTQRRAPIPHPYSDYPGNPGSGQSPGRLEPGIHFCQPWLAAMWLGWPPHVLCALVGQQAPGSLGLPLLSVSPKVPSWKGQIRNPGRGRKSLGERERGMGAGSRAVLGLSRWLGWEVSAPRQGEDCIVRG